MPADGSIFRKQALDKLSSPEHLTRLLQVPGAKPWLLLSACAWTIAVALAWSWYGRVPSRVHASGILIDAAGLADVVAPTAGQISALTIDVGDEVQPGQVLAKLAHPELVSEIDIQRAQLAELQRSYDQSRQQSSQDMQLRASASGSERVGLNSLIDASLQEQRDLTERLRTQGQLLEKGLVTQDAVLTTRRELRAAENRVKTLQAELDRSTSSTFSMRRANDAELQSNAQRIQELERHLELLVEKLRQQAEIVSTQAGRVVEVRASVGDVLAPGTPIVSLERSAGRGTLEAALYVDARIGKRVQPGMQVSLAPSTVRRERFGVMLGEVVRVESFASTHQGMMRVLHNQSLVDALFAAAGGAPIAIRAKLRRDDATPSGYRWSSGRGPRSLLSSGTPLEAAITTDTQRPISLIFRLFDSLD